MCRKISAHVDGGLSGGSRVRRPGSEDPHRRERKFFNALFCELEASDREEKEKASSMTSLADNGVSSFFVRLSSSKMTSGA